MRGSPRRSEGLFAYIRLEERIAADHPLRAIRSLTNEVLAALSPRFEALYSHLGGPSIPPEYLLRATLLQAFLSVRSERQLMEQIDYNLRIPTHPVGCSDNIRSVNPEYPVT